MKKLAFYEIAPLKNKSKKQHDSSKGHAKELLNMAAGATVGGASGGIIGGVLGGAATAGNPIGLIGGALSGGAIGAASGAYKSLRGTEENAKVESSSKGKFFGRMTAAAGLGLAGAGAGFSAAAMTGNNPMAGALLGGAAGAYLGDRAVRGSDSKPNKKKYLYQYR